MKGQEREIEKQSLPSLLTRSLKMTIMLHMTYSAFYLLLEDALLSCLEGEGAV